MGHEGMLVYEGMSGVRGYALNKNVNFLVIFFVLSMNIRLLVFYVRGNMAFDSTFRGIVFNYIYVCLYKY